MSDNDERCSRCDRAECPTLVEGRKAEGRRVSTTEATGWIADCDLHKVDWRARARTNRKALSVALAQLDRMADGDEGVERAREMARAALETV
jgi:hypothetical protein